MKICNQSYFNRLTCCFRIILVIKLIYIIIGLSLFRFRHQFFLDPRFQIYLLIGVQLTDWNDKSAQLVLLNDLINKYWVDCFLKLLLDQWSTDPRTIIGEKDANHAANVWVNLDYRHYNPIVKVSNQIPWKKLAWCASSPFIRFHGQWLNLLKQTILRILKNLHFRHLGCVLEF